MDCKICSLSIIIIQINLLGNPELFNGVDKANNLLSNVNVQNGYTYPSAYAYNSGIGYPYSLDQNTKEQMEAYNKLMIASYQNGQQFYSQSQYPLLSPTQQQTFSNTSNNVQNNQDETKTSTEDLNDDNKKQEESPINSNTASYAGVSIDSNATALTSNMLPSPTCNVSNLQNSSNSSASTPSCNLGQPSPQATTNIPQQLSPTNLQQYSPTNSFNSWTANNFSYTADNPYAAFYNNPNVAAAAMYNQSMNMGVHPQAYFAGTGSQQQQPDSTTSNNMNRGWAQHPTNTPSTYPFHPATFMSPYSDPTTAAALFSNYASLWNTHHNTNQYFYGNALQQPQVNSNSIMNNLSMEKMRETCDKQSSNQSIPQNTQHQLKSFYNENHQLQSQQHYDKSQLATSTTINDQNNLGINSANHFSSLTSSPNQSIDLELTYRNNPELAEKLRQVSLKKPRVTFSIKQVVELEKEFHSSR